MRTFGLREQTLMVTASPFGLRTVGSILDKDDGH
jgi:hypothetical protein